MFDGSYNLIVCHHPAKFGGHGCGSRDVFILSPDLARPRDQNAMWLDGAGAHQSKLPSCQG